MNALLCRSLATLALLLALLPGAAFANGKPIQIVLGYQPGLSTTGATNAAGVAELVMAEGEVRVVATGLPRLDPPETYQAWVVNTSTNEVMALGPFNTAFTTGVARLDTVLPSEIPDRGWNLFLLTIETDPKPARPSDRRVIAGAFPPAGTEPQPNLLPNTGGPEALLSGGTAEANRANWLLAAGLVALMLAISAVAGFVVGRNRPSTKA